MTVRLNPAKEVRRLARSGGGATAMGGSVMLRTSEHALDGPEHIGQLPTERLSTTAPDGSLATAVSGDVVWVMPGAAGAAILACSTIDQVLALLGLVPPVFDPGDLCMLFPEA
jgi:hypothetical protein